MLAQNRDRFFVAGVSYRERHHGAYELGDRRWWVICGEAIIIAHNHNSRGFLTDRLGGCEMESARERRLARINRATREVIVGDETEDLTDTVSLTDPRTSRPLIE